jgi:hypothetical protein
MVMMRAMKSTPIVEMEKMGGTQALSKGRDTKVLIQAEKFLRIPNLPMKERFRNLALGRLKRSSFVHQAKSLLRQNPELPKIVIPQKSLYQSKHLGERCL